MIFWILVLALMAAVLGLLAWPLLRRGGAATPRADYDLAVYRDQLAELERDTARGLLSADQAAIARGEIERRMLAAAPKQGAETPSQPAAGAGAARGLLAGLVLVVPLSALGLYLLLGTPGLPGLSLAERQAMSGTEDLPALVDRLARRLAQSPGDAAGWALLGQTYAQLDRYAEAANAFRQAIAQGEDSAAAHASLGEVLTALDQGRIGPAAREAFATALERDPNDPRALYYGGLAYAQANRLEDALHIWRGLAAVTPPDAPWKTLLDQQIAAAQEALGEAPAPGSAPGPAPALGPRAAPGPSQEEMAAAAAMSQQDQAAMIQSMVARLAARLEDEPDDIEGWLRLIRAYGVLEQRDAALAALEKAEAAAAKLPAEAPQRAALARARAALESGQ